MYQRGDINCIMTKYISNRFYVSARKEIIVSDIRGFSYYIRGEYITKEIILNLNKKLK